MPLLPLHTGTFPFHVPSLHVMLLLPSNVKPRWHVKVTFFPCLKSLPLLLPFCGAPGLVQLSVKLETGHYDN